MHRIEFRQIVRDAEIAYAIYPVVRGHHLTEEETEKFLLELRIPRVANVARITLTQREPPNARPEPSRENRPESKRGSHVKGLRLTWLRPV